MLSFDSQHWLQAVLTTISDAVSHTTLTSFKLLPESIQPCTMTNILTSLLFTTPSVASPPALTPPKLPSRRETCHRERLLCLLRGQSSASLPLSCAFQQQSATIESHQVGYIHALSEVLRHRATGTKCQIEGLA